MILKISLKSLMNRKASAMLTLFSIAISIFVLLGVDHLRHEAKHSFNRTVSGIDLIVGPRTGSMNLLLYSVFQVGYPTHQLSWNSYEKITKNPKIAWSIPFALGDSHKSFPVLATNIDYFKHYKFGQQQTLTFFAGEAFQDVLQTVIGSEVAAKLGYQIGDQITLSHGSGGHSFTEHADTFFTVSGILNPTGTAIDRNVIVTLTGLDNIHSGMPHTHQHEGHDHAKMAHDEHDHAKMAHEEHDHAKMAHDEHDHAKMAHDEHDHAKMAHEEHEHAKMAHDEHDHAKIAHEEHEHAKMAHDEHDHAKMAHEEHDHAAHQSYQGSSLTTVYIGLKNKAETFQVQKSINDFNDEALIAILPGVTLTELWGMMRSVEQLLLVIALLVLISALLGMSTMLLASMNARHHELSLMRAIGAHPMFILCLIQIEALTLTLGGIILGLLMLFLSLWVSKGALIEHFGLYISANFFTFETLLLCLGILIANSCIALIPSINAYRLSLLSGLSDKS